MFVESMGGINQYYALNRMGGDGEILVINNFTLSPFSTIMDIISAIKYHFYCHS